MRKRAKIAIVVAVLLIAGVVGGIVHDPRVARCFLLRSYELDQIEPGLYVERGFSPEQRESLRQTVRAARARVDSFLGDRVGKPIIIAGGLETFRRYGTPGRDFSVTKTTPLSDYIVLGREGTNVDCLSHELVHVELRRRLGYLKYWRGLIPAWFDEGAAMFVDDRPAFDERAYQELLSKGGSVPALSTIASCRDFYQNRTAYIVAKHEFGEWYKTSGRNGFLDLLKAVRDGEDFSAVYRNRPDNTQHGGR